MNKNELSFHQRKQKIEAEYKALINKPNHELFSNNGIYSKFINPILTRDHIPLYWRYDLNIKTNPHFMERIGFNATFNSGAIKWHGKYLLIVRVEGIDRKSFFAVAESPNGIDNFRFWDRPITLTLTENAETNVYDMRITQHEDGWVYGVFCAERKDPVAPEGDTSSAIASAGIVRTKDFIIWERLPDLISHSGQQRNVVLFENFISGKYAFFTRPQDGFIDTGRGGGIGFGLADNIEKAEILTERIMDAKQYHTVYEVKNGQGPHPLKTEKGWLHLAHGVRNTAAGLRYTLYMFMTELDDITKISYKPAGHFIAPMGGERVGDVSNVVFSNGWILDDDGTVFIYYASSDTRMHVAKSSVNKLLDYCMYSPQDKFHSFYSVETINALISKNIKFL